MKNKVIPYFVILVLAAGIFSAPALADTSTTTPATASSTAATASSTSSFNVSIGSIDSELDQLANIQNNDSIATDTKITEEISAQQDILNAVITLSTNEIAAVQTKLNDLPTFDKDSKEYSLQSNYLAELSSYNEYFQQESAVVANAETLSQLQTIAANIKSFRDAGYNTEISNMLTFTLLYYDAGIISTAKTRLDSVLSDLTTLENAQLLSNSSILDGYVGQATHLINNASTLHNEASNIILEDSTSTSATSTPSTSTVSPRSLIERSITDVKDAYNFFIEISTNINTQLSY